MSRKLTSEDAFVTTWSGPPPTHIIETVGSLYIWMGTCPHAQTLEAWSARFKCTVWIPLPCKQWRCRHCAQKKISRLSSKCEKAKPNRLMTLTVDPSLWEHPRAAFDGTRRQVPELFRKLRLKVNPIDYLRVTELTKGGWPHYHCLVRSPYLPHPIVKTAWQDLTGAIIVDIRQVKDNFATYTYLVKYLSKMHEIGWTERHVSYSKNFFPPEDTTPDSKLELQEPTILETHPSTLLYTHFRKSQLVELAWNVYALNPPADAVERATDDGSATITVYKGKPPTPEKPHDQPQKKLPRPPGPKLFS